MKSFCGADNGRAKLTEDQVIEILRSPLNSVELKNTGRFPVSSNTIRDIRAGVSWTYLYQSIKQPRRPTCRGGASRGERNYNAKLTVAQAQAIANSQEDSGVVAKKYGISPSTVRGIRTGASWQHLHRARDAKKMPPMVNNKTKLSVAEVRNIRAVGYGRHCKKGVKMTAQQLADKYGVSVHTIHRIVLGKSWAWVE